MRTLPSKEPEVGLFKKVWRRYNELREYVESLPVRPGRNVKVQHTSSGQMLTANPRGVVQEPGEPGTIKRYLVQSVEHDHLVCDEVDGSAGVLVAKPWRLQRTPFHGQSISFIDERNRTYVAFYNYLSAVLRQVTILTVSEFQVIIPRYKPGFDYIYAATAENGTGVTVTTGTGPTAVVTSVELVDINVDGRAWARER